jgi:hypothetical protein
MRASTSMVLMLSLLWVIIKIGKSITDIGKSKIKAMSTI